MRLLAAAILAIAALAVTPAHAQSGWGMSQPVGGNVGELSQLSPAHGYWEACRSETAETAARACGRVIGARISRVHTGTAHYFRSVALESLGDSERALSDLRRAYGMFCLVLDADDADANALYGRGLTLIRLGHTAEGEADIARAEALSEGRVGEFFEANYEH